MTKIGAGHWWRQEDGIWRPLEGDWGIRAVPEVTGVPPLHPEFPHSLSHVRPSVHCYRGASPLQHQLDPWIRLQSHQRAGAELDNSQERRWISWGVPYVLPRARESIDTVQFRRKMPRRLGISWRDSTDIAYRGVYFRSVINVRSCLKGSPTFALRSSVLCIATGSGSDISQLFHL